MLAEVVHQYLNNCQDFEPITHVGHESEKSYLVPRSTFEPAEESAAKQSKLDCEVNLALSHKDASQVYQMLGKIPYHAGKEFKEIWKKDAAE